MQDSTDSPAVSSAGTASPAEPKKKIAKQSVSPEVQGEVSDGNDDDEGDEASRE